jgi:hypothetical protein
MCLFTLALVLLANIRWIGIEIVGKNCSSLFAEWGNEKEEQPFLFYHRC